MSTRDDSQTRPAEKTRVESLPADQLTRLLGQLGHEVGTPLGSVLMMAEMLAGSADETVRRRAASLKRAAHEIRDVMQAFVRLLRLRTGWLDPEPTELSPGELAEILRQVRAAAGAAGAEISGELPELRLDKAFVREALELCATWAGARDGGFDLLVEPAGDGGLDASALYCELRCPGGPIPWDKDAILDPLGAGDLVPARRHGGPGLELPLARMLLWRLGGRLEGRYDEAEGENVVALTLPARADDPLAAA